MTQKRMRVLIHTDEYYPTAQACSYRMQVLAESFKKHGDKVTVICSSANLENGTLPIQKRPEKIIYAPTIKMKKKTTVMRLLNNLSFGISSVFASLKAGRADLVITTSPPLLASIPGWVIAKIKGAKLVYDVRDIWPDVAVEMGSFSSNSLYYRVFRFIAQFMYRHADIITTVSPGKMRKIQGYVREMAKGSGRNYSEKKVWLVGNGYDANIEDYPIDHELVKTYDLEHTFTCVYVGNIGLAQGLEVLLDLAAGTKHKDVRFLVFGKGAERERLEQMARERGLSQLRFCGVLPHEDIHTLLKYARLSFIPLKNSNMKDSVPTKLYEALGLGCPVLLVAEGDSCNVIEETKLGRHISPDHPEQIVHVFDDMVDHYDSILQFREAAVNTIHETYTRQKIADEFVSRMQKINKGY